MSLARRPPATQHPRLLTAQAAAALLGLPYTTVRDLLLRGTLPRVEVPGLRRLLVDADALERLVERWRVPAAPWPPPPLAPPARGPSGAHRGRRRGRVAQDIQSPERP